MEKGEEFAEDDIQKFEKELLGLSLSGKSINELLGNFINLSTHRIGDLNRQDDFTKDIRLTGIISEIRTIITKSSGKEMSFIKIEDETGTIDAIIFPDVYEKFKFEIFENNAILASGKLDHKVEDCTLIVGSLSSLSTQDQTVYISIPNNCDISKLKNLKKFLISIKGKDKVCLIFEKNNEKKYIPININWTEENAKIISEILNSEKLTS